VGENGTKLEESLDTADSAQRVGLLADAVGARDAQPDQLVRAAAQKLALSAARVGAVADDLGVSERQLHRRVVAAVGYGRRCSLESLGCDDSSSSRILAWRRELTPRATPVRHT